MVLVYSALDGLWSSGSTCGYSSIWLARTLPAGGRLVTLEADAKHAEVARSNIARAGLAERVEVRRARAGSAAQGQAVGSKGYDGFTLAVVVCSV